MIGDIIEAIANVEAESAALQALGLKRAYPDAPTAVQEPPVIINVPGKGVRLWPPTSNLRSVNHEVHAQVLISKGDVTSADKAAKQWIEAMIATFEGHMQLGGLVTRCGVKSYDYGKIEYAAVEYLGVDFVLGVDERTQVVYTP